MKTVTACSKYKHKIDLAMLNKTEQMCGDSYWGLFYFRRGVKRCDIVLKDYTKAHIGRVQPNMTL